MRALILIRISRLSVFYFHHNFQSSSAALPPSISTSPPQGSSNPPSPLPFLHPTYYSTKNSQSTLSTVAFTESLWYLDPHTSFLPSLLSFECCLESPLWPHTPGYITRGMKSSVPLSLLPGDYPSMISHKAHVLHELLNFLSRRGDLRSSCLQIPVYICLRCCTEHNCPLVVTHPCKSSPDNLQDVNVAEDRTISIHKRLLQLNMASSIIPSLIDHTTPALPPVPRPQPPPHPSTPLARVLKKNVSHHPVPSFPSSILATLMK